MLVHRFRNGNFNIKFEADDFDYSEGTLIKLIYSLYDYDCSIFGEEYCLSNYDMAIDMYCYYTDRIIRIPYSLLNDLEDGKTIKLHARKLTKDDREELAQLEEWGEI